MWPTEATGLVSVMPQACMIGMPTFARKPSDSVFGTADPPHGMARKLDVSRPSSSGSTPIQMVGTPAATVTFWSSMSFAIAGGDRSGPGITSDAPRRDGRVRESPRVGVEHRDDGQDHVGLLHADTGRHHRRHRVEERRAV